MKTLQEITKWDYNIPNHIYFLSDDKTKLFAYIIEGTKKVLKLSTPLRFSVSRRKFIDVPNTFGFKEEKSSNPSWNVIGSNGDSYTVEKTNNSYICSCPGFKFRRSCKHIISFNGMSVGIE